MADNTHFCAYAEGSFKQMPVNGKWIDAASDKRLQKRK
jgi:hypothetical protein